MENILSNSEMSTLVELLNKLASQSFDKKVLVFNTACCSLKFQYPINEDKLDKLAENYSIDEWGYTEKVTMNHFKAGYRKAMEE